MIRCIYIDLHYCSLITEIVICNYLVKHLFRYRVLATWSVQLHFDNAFFMRTQNMETQNMFECSHEIHTATFLKK